MNTNTTRTKKRRKRAHVKDILGFDPSKGEDHLTRFRRKKDLLTVSQPTPLAQNIHLPKGFIATKFTSGGRIS